MLAVRSNDSPKWAPGMTSPKPWAHRPSVSMFAVGAPPVVDAPCAQELAATALADLAAQCTPTHLRDTLLSEIAGAANGFPSAERALEAAADMQSRLLAAIVAPQSGCTDRDANTDDRYTTAVEVLLRHLTQMLTAPFEYTDVGAEQQRQPPPLGSFTPPTDNDVANVDRQTTTPRISILEASTAAALPKAARKAKGTTQTPRGIEIQLGEYSVLSAGERSANPTLPSAPHRGERTPSPVGSSSSVSGRSSPAASGGHHVSASGSRVTASSVANRSGNSSDRRTSASFQRNMQRGSVWSLAGGVSRRLSLAGGQSLSLVRSISSGSSGRALLRSGRSRLTVQASVTEGCEDGTTEVNEYVLLYELGKGAQGEVFLAMDTRSNRMRAIKAIPRGALSPRHPKAAGGGGLRAVQARTLKRQLDREITILTKCRHKHVVALYEVIDDPSVDYIYLVMQYVDDGPLATVDLDGRVSRTLPPGRMLRVLRQIASALQYLHEHGVVHRDLKPDNILLSSNGDVFVADFGTSDLFDRSCSASEVSGTRGTLAFQAPELLTAEGTGKVDGRAVDVWALGVTVYALLFGKLPFGNTNASPADYFRAVKSCPIDFTLPLCDDAAPDATSLLPTLRHFEATSAPVSCAVPAVPGPAESSVVGMTSGGGLLAVPSGGAEEMSSSSLSPPQRTATMNPAAEVTAQSAACDPATNAPPVRINAALEVHSHSDIGADFTNSCLPQKEGAAETETAGARLAPAGCATPRTEKDPTSARTNGRRPSSRPGERVLEVPGSPLLPVDSDDNAGPSAAGDVAVGLVRRMLERNPAERITLPQLLEALAAPF